MKELWITNVTKKDIFIYDLNFTVKALTSINILDPRHRLTEDMVNKSFEQGSLSKKKHEIIRRVSAPDVTKLNFIPISQNFRPSSERGIRYDRSLEPNYEELDITDEQFAEEYADMAELDRQPLIKKS